jgi:hypothetical protein
VGSLRVNLGLDSAQFEKGAKRSQNTLATMRKRFLVVSAAAAAMGAALSTAALKGAQDIDRAAKAARRLDSSVGGFRALELAAGEAGVSMSVLADSVQTMDREIAKGSKGAGEALERLGLTARSLEGLDADQKIATIADAIQDMGLTTADASVVLQQLGVRNREMVLAVTSGGAALRDARRDIEDYGLAINAVDSARIEKANDQIGRLGLISQYAGQQLAVALVPAMGRLAQVMTDSLREGGLLREVIDGLVGNLDRLAAIAGAAVAVFGVRYVGALAAATFGTASLSGALIFLRTALIKTGIGAAIVAVGELVLWLGRAQTATGSFGAAFQKIGLQVKAASLDMKAWFIDALNGMIGAFIEFTYKVAEGLNTLFGSSLTGMDATVTQELALAAAAARKSADEARAAAKALNITLEDTGDTASDTANSIRKIEDAAGGAGGGMKKAKDDAVDMAGAFDGPVTSAIDGVAQTFGDFVARGFKDFKGFTQSILSSFKSMLAQMIATAARNKIMLAIGGTASVAGGAANAAGGLLGGIGGAVGAAGGIGGALSAVGSGLGGILSGGGLGASFANLGGLVGGSVSGAGAIGAALPALGVIAAPLAIGALLLGRRRKRRRRRREAEQQRVAAEQAEQQRLAQVAEVAFGLDTRILELQGKGVEALTRVRERELASIDASLRPRLEQIFALEDMNRIMDERFGIENRLLELQGRGAEVLARNRQKEVEATDAANRAILQQVFALEDQAEAAEAAAEAVRMGQAAIQRTMDLFRAPLSLDSDRFNDRFSATMQAAEDRRFQVQKEAESAQLTELKLMRLALEELRREQRDVRLYGSVV